MSLPKKCIGFVFKMHEPTDEGSYFLSIGNGHCHFKADAYVYTSDELIDHVTSDLGWGCKKYGKWIAVYEDVATLLPYQQPPVFLHE